MPFLSYNLTTHNSAIFCQKDAALELAKVKRERDLYKRDCEDKERRIQEYYGILAQNETQLEAKTEELLVSFLFIISYTDCKILLMVSRIWKESYLAK